MKQVEVYTSKVLHPDNLNNYDWLYSCMNSKKTERIRSFRYIEDKLRCLTGELLLRTVLSKKLNIQMVKIEIEEDSKGKPYLYNESSSNIQFNISHSSDWAVCAFSEGKVGIDIEYIDKVDFNEIAKFFSKTEIANFNLASDQKKSDYFFDLWTLKESFIKATGKGMSMPLNSFSIVPAEKSIQLISDLKINYYFKQYKLDPEYKLSVCSEINSFKPEVTYIKL